MGANCSGAGVVACRSEDEVLVDPPGLKMVLRMSTSADTDQRKEVNFTRSPLGMSFATARMPMIVGRVLQDGEAMDLGVQLGMVIERIGEADVTELTYEEAFSFMQRKVEELPKVKETS